MDNNKDNLEIWEKVRTPDPAHTKPFNRGGGFKGTATNTQYLVQKATELWGPNGYGWGLEITNESYVEGAYLDETNKAVVHVVRGFVWYTHDGSRAETSPQFGQTTFVGKTKNGIFTDEEAPKKSVSDLMAKCLSLLGFSADIFLGMWDDNKYLNDVKKRFEDQKKGSALTAVQREKYNKTIAWLNSFSDIDSLNKGWAKLGEKFNEFDKKQQDALNTIYASHAKKFTEETLVQGQ